MGLAFLDQDLRYLLVNESLAERNGVSAESQIGKPLIEVSPGYREAVRRISQELTSGSSGVVTQEAITQPVAGSDEPRYWLERWFPVKTQAGAIFGIGAVIEETTERRRAERALKESEERYRATFANAPVGIAHVAFDGKWIRFNEALCRITGYAEEELRDKTFEHITHPDDVEADWVLAQRLARGELPAYSMEKRYIRKDGAVVWVNLTVSLLRDPEGTPLNFISVVQDITARTEAEEALRERERELRSMVDSIDQLAWMADADGSVFWYNRRWYEYTGTTLEQVAGRGWDAVLDPSVLDEMKAEWAEAVRTGRSIDMISALAARTACCGLS